jgi:hypothetical protein
MPSARASQLLCGVSQIDQIPRINVPAILHPQIIVRVHGVADAIFSIRQDGARDVRRAVVIHVAILDANPSLNKVENVFDHRMAVWVLVPTLDDEQQNATPFSYEMALLIRRRLVEEQPNRDIRLSLTPTGEEIDSGFSTTSTPDKDGRQVMSYKGLLVYPGFNSRQGIPCWYCRFPGHAIESVSGETPEQAVDTVYERNLQSKAEHAPTPQPEPGPVVSKKNSSGRSRPGDM